MWSSKYELNHCIICGTDERKHAGKNRCTRCFYRYQHNVKVPKNVLYPCPVCHKPFLNITNTHMKKHPEFFERKIPIDQLARLLGHMIGDGGINKQQYGFVMHYTNTSQYLINQIKKEVEEIFGDIHIYQRKKKMDGYHKTPCFDLIFPRYVGKYIINRFGDIFTNTQKRIPLEIINGSAWGKCMFLQSLFDDEGTANTASGQITINVNKGNKILALQIYDLLTSLKIQCSLPSDYSKNNGNKNWSWRLTISRAYEYQKIGFSHPKKQEKLESILKIRDMSKLCRLCNIPLFGEGDIYNPHQKYCPACSIEERKRRNKLYNKPIIATLKNDA